MNKQILLNKLYGLKSKLDKYEQIYSKNNYSF